MAREEPLLRLIPEGYARARDHHEFGGGYSLRHSQEDFSVSWRFLDVHDHGACVVRVAGVQARPQELQLPAFAPGRPVELRLQPDDPHGAEAIAVWDESGSACVGYVARQSLFDVRSLLFGDEPVQAIVLWDWRTEEGIRTGLNLLIARTGVVADLDAPARRFERPARARTAGTAPALALAAVVWVVLASLFGLAGVVAGALLALVLVVALRRAGREGVG